jgi:hypothetical protein
MVVGVLAIAIALAVAVVKPWESDGNPGAPGPSFVVAAAPSIVPSPSVAPAPSARIARAAAPASAQLPVWAEVERAIEAHDTWGVRAILVGRRPGDGSGDSPDYMEHWSGMTPDPDGLDTAYIAPDDQSIVALGVTFPPDLGALDARIWRVHVNDELEWIDARPLQQGHPDGAFLFLRFGTDGARFQEWDAGHYRIDVLARDGVHRMALEVPGRIGIVPGPDEGPLAASASSLIAPLDSDPSEVPFGPFLTVGGTGVPLAVTPGPFLTEAEAWLAAIGHDTVFARPTVARTYAPRATGIGVMLTSHAAVRFAVVRRLSPDARINAHPMLGGLSNIHAWTPWVAFAAPGGGAWPPGVYALTVRWTDAVGLHESTWHIELRPGPLRGSVAPP